jgi:hypothetical protein
VATPVVFDIDISDSVQAAADDTVPEDIRHWSISRCTAWLKKRTYVGTLPSRRSDLQEMVQLMYEKGLQNSSRANLEEVAKKRFTANRAAWVRVAAARADGAKANLDTGEDCHLLPHISEESVRWSFEMNEANTARNRDLGSTRFITNLHYHTSDEECSPLGFKYRNAFATATVGKSYPGTNDTNLEKQSQRDSQGHSGRVVCMEGIVTGYDRKGLGGHWLGTPKFCCLIPEQYLDDDNETVKSAKGFRPCRDGGSGRCVHCASLGNAVATVIVGVDGPNKWAASRDKNRSHDRDQYADELPIKRKGASGDDKRGKRGRFVPIRPEQLAEINKGPLSKVYRPKLNEYIEAKKAYLKRKRGDDETLQDRPLKIETILEPVDGCNCKWSPTIRAWEGPDETVTFPGWGVSRDPNSGRLYWWDKATRTTQWHPPGPRCSVCCGPNKKYTIAYVYDKGLTRTGPLIKSGVQVFIPSRKASGQIAFDDAANTSDRYIARERITIERNNLELRYYDGFDCLIHPSAIDLAGAEGSAARGLCNLRIQLVDWCARSYKGRRVDLSR